MKRIILVFVMIMVANTSFARQWLIIYAEKISFNAPVGHTFAAFIQEDIFQKQTKIVGYWGFYPKNKIPKGLFQTIPGKLKDDWSTKRDYSFLVEVTSEEFNRCLRIKSIYEKRNIGYNLYVQSCVNFIRDIVKAIPKLRVPNANFRLPSSVVQELKRLNSSIEKESTTNLASSGGSTLPSSSFWPFAEDSTSSSDSTIIATGTPDALANLTGGITPDQLGQIIFKAFQTNNKNLFISCIHPHPIDDDRDRIAEDFVRLREELEESGLTQWALTRYGRVTYGKAIELNGEQKRREFTIEFTYKGQEFVGVIEGGDIVTYKNKYFIWHRGFASRLSRIWNR